MQEEHKVCLVLLESIGKKIGISYIVIYLFYFVEYGYYLAVLRVFLVLCSEETPDEAMEII